MFSTSDGITRALEVVKHRRVKRRSRHKRSSEDGNETESTAEATLKLASSATDSSEAVLLQFTAFSEPFRLRLWPNHKLLSPSFQMVNEISGSQTRSRRFKSKKENSESGDEAAKVMESLESLASIEDCFYQGFSETHPESAVALSLCNGMVSLRLDSFLSYIC